MRCWNEEGVRGHGQRWSEVGTNPQFLFEFSTLEFIRIPNFLIYLTLFSNEAGKASSASPTNGFGFRDTSKKISPGSRYRFLNFP